MIEVNCGWCGGGLALDWVNLCDFSSNYHKNWSVFISLAVKDHCVSSSGDCGAMIASNTAMLNQGGFWEVWGKAREPDGKGSFGIVGGWWRRRNLF